MGWIACNCGGFGYLGSWAVSIESTASQFDNLKNLGTVVVLFFVDSRRLLVGAFGAAGVSLKAKTYALWQIVWSQPSDNSIDCVDATVRDCYCRSGWWFGVRSVILPPVVSIGF